MHILKSNYCPLSVGRFLYVVTQCYWITYTGHMTHLWCQQYSEYVEKCEEVEGGRIRQDFLKQYPQVRLPCLMFLCKYEHFNMSGRIRSEQVVLWLESWQGKEDGSVVWWFVPAFALRGTSGLLSVQISNAARVGTSWPFVFVWLTFSVFFTTNLRVCAETTAEVFERLGQESELLFNQLTVQIQGVISVSEKNYG